MTHPDKNAVSDRNPAMELQLIAIVRILARQAAREHLASVSRDTAFTKGDQNAED